ncbi:PAS domain-containing protein [Phormidium sp. LEGE 05292]|uniref:PAS domain-containing protein n=1 Tax=[Phormidium] sp. LEGE 05292 TaxID=767427 RepID=UPI00188090A1|nr:PAS domain-containing protein [Phormidium sp. LEGE 05292]MBE9229302.1 PAS domain-containing protein [Phormidium sp. LEGE 05292]
MRFYQRLVPYGVAIGSTAIALLLTLWLEPFMFRTIGTFFYLAIIVTAWYGDLRSGFVTVVFSTLAINYFFIPPQHIFGFDRGKDVFELGIFLLVSVTINLLTDRFRDSKQLAQEKAKLLLRIAPSAAQMGMWNWDIPTGQIQWSVDHELLFGLTPGMFDGRYESFLACLYPDDREPINQALQQAIEKNSLYQVEYRVVWPDGSIHWIEARGHAFYNQAGEPIHMTGTATAIDQRKQAQGLLQEKFEQQRLIMEITQKIRQSLNIEEIFQTTVNEIRQLLQTDRVIIFQFDPKWRGTVVAESVGTHWIAILSTEIYDPCFGENYVEPYKQGLVTVKSDIYKAGIDPCHLQLLANFQVRANLVVPIVKGGELWGLLIAHNCAAPRQWQSTEIDFMRQLANQMSIAIQQSELFEQVQTELRERKQAERALQQLNAELEQRIQERTAKLSEVNDRLIEALTALQESEESRRLALDLTHVGFWDMQLPSEYLVWNDIKFTLLGLDPFSIKPTRELWRSHVHPDDLGWVEQKFLESIENQTDYAAEHRVIYPDGSVHWLMSRAKAVYNELGQPVRVLGVLLDISDRKRTEQILELQAVITRNMAEGVCLVRASDAVIVYANPKFEQMFDYDSGELNDRHVSIVNYATEEVTAEDVTQAIRSAVLQNGEAIYEVHNVKKDGTPFWCKATCSVFKHPDYGDVLVAVHQDITLAKHLEEVRQQVEEALRQSEAKFRSLSESSPVGIFMTNTQGDCIYINPRHQMICGCTFDEALGKSWVEFIHPEDREEVAAEWAKVLSQRQEYSSETRYIRKDGTIRFGRVLFAPIFSAVDEFVGYVGTVEDITDSRAIEIMKKEFISIVSHELRTPLAAIRGSMGLLASGVLQDKPETAQQMLDIAVQNTERLVRLVNDILDLERLEARTVKLNKQWCDGVTLMQQSVKTVQSLAVQSNITLFVEPTSVQVWADSDLIVQTLVNLIGNAIKFSPPETIVTLSIQDQTDQILFQIQDQGRGIPADKIDTIFGRFQQVDASDSRQKGGTGLGLAICKSIVKQHGGKIWVESVVGEGSSFYFTLPKLLD